MPIQYDSSVPLDNKQVRLYDDKKRFIRLSVDEIIARKLNIWKNWYCSAGERSLYIDYDGLVWISNCASASYYREEWKKYSEKYIGPWPHKEWYNHNTEEGWPLPEDYEKSSQHLKFLEEVDKLEKKFFSNKKQGKFDKGIQDNYFGYIGNIYDRLEYKDSWVQCPFDFCGCGADVILSKCKSPEHLDKLAVSKSGYKGQFNTKKNFVSYIDDFVAMEMNFPIHFQLLWDLGRRCNYDCTYCWNGLHNLKDPHHDYYVIRKTILSIIKNWARNHQIRWNFGGGEPTLHPNFLDITKLLKEKNQWVLVTTNGSRDVNYWNDLKKYCNTINFSAHFESMSKHTDHEKRFINNVQTVMDYHNTVDDDFWLEVKLMTPPGYVEHALKFKDKLNVKELYKPGKNGRMKGCYSLVPIRNDKGISDYSPEEIKLLESQ